MIKAEDIGTLGTLIYNEFYTPIVLATIGFIFESLKKALRKTSLQLQDDFSKELIGTVAMYREIPIVELAKRVNESVAAVEEQLARLRQNGLFKGYIDRNGIVHFISEEEAMPQPIPTPIEINQADTDKEKPLEDKQESQESIEETETEGTQVISLSESKEERIRKIKEMYEKGLISEETYRKALKELEEESNT